MVGYIHRKDKWNLSNITFRHAILAWHTKDNTRHLFHPYRGQREKQMTTLNTLLSRYASRFPNAFFFGKERTFEFLFVLPAVFVERGGGPMFIIKLRANGFFFIAGFMGLKGRNPYFGSTVGRVANRIAKGRFRLDGVEYRLATNNGDNHLHGGNVGFDKVHWQPYVHDDGSVTFTYSSPHMEEGYPGHLYAQVTYT